MRHIPFSLLPEERWPDPWALQKQPASFTNGPEPAFPYRIQAQFLTIHHISRSKILLRFLQIVTDRAIQAIKLSRVLSAQRIF
jgi:hypothetical protein